MSKNVEITRETMHKDERTEAEQVADPTEDEKP